MERYVDGFVIPVPDEKLDAYREMAKEAGKIWMKHGALSYFEGVGEDMDPEMGEASIRTFPELADAAADESVIFAFILYKSRDHRDKVNTRVMADPAMDPSGPEEEWEMPFETSRMTYGGFRALVNYEH